MSEITDEQRQKIKDLMDKPLDLIIADGFEAVANSIRHAREINGKDVVGPSMVDRLYEVIKSHVAPFAIARFLIQGYLEEMGMTLDEAIDKTNADAGLDALFGSIVSLNDSIKNLHDSINKFEETGEIR